jgi:SAM-dependent methyltransferase
MHLEIVNHIRAPWSQLLARAGALQGLAALGRWRSAIDIVNRERMARAVDEYQWSDELESRERNALATVIEKVKDRPILDLGVGAGRTVKDLLQISRDYTGVDYVPEMVDHCREAFPGVRFEHGDARSLSRFPDQSFALVFFSCSGIGMVDHDGRLLILNEVYRVLMRGGFFVFSTANLNSPNARRVFVWPRVVASTDPLSFMVRRARFLGDVLVSIVNRLRFKRHEAHTPTYAILNDVSHNYGTFAYFITLENQRRQLQDAGFLSDAVVFDLSGRRVETDTTDGSMTIVATKA